MLAYEFLEEPGHELICTISKRARTYKKDDYGHTVGLRIEVSGEVVKIIGSLNLADWLIYWNSFSRLIQFIDLISHFTNL